MQQLKINKNINDLDDQIDLIELFHIFLKRKWIILSITGFFSFSE